MNTAVSDRKASSFPVWHTAVLLAIIAVLTLLGARQPFPTGAGHRLSGYLLAAAFEWAMFGWIVFGCRIKGASLLTLMGEFSARWRTIFRDIGIAIGYLVAANIVLSILGRFITSKPDQAVKNLLPHTTLEQVAFVGVAITAGFCEELIFRGYLQRQFTAWTGNAAVALVLQGVVFGIAHAYQGLGRVLLIAVYGCLFGLLALWRKSLRPGMIAHMLQDGVVGLLARKFLK